MKQSTKGSTQSGANKRTKRSTTGRKKQMTALPKLETIVFIVVAVYLLAFAVKFFNKDTLAVYEVAKSDLIDTIKETGFIIREEKIVESDGSGYICYYTQDGSRVKQDGTVYVLDKSGKVKQYIASFGKEKGTIDEKEKEKVYDQIKYFTESYTDEKFENVYEAKKDIENKFVAYTDAVFASHKTELINKFGENGFKEVTSKDAGIVCLSYDGQEDMKEEDITKETFKEHIKSKDLRTEDKVKSGSPVYRLITDQKWRLVVPLTEYEYQRLRRLQKHITDNHMSNDIKVDFYKDNFSVNAHFLLKCRGGQHFIVLYFTDYVMRYRNQRFLSVGLTLSEEAGLKIPASSLTSKTCYKIPSMFLSKGGNSTVANQVNIVDLANQDEDDLVQQKVNIFRNDGEYAWISTDGLKQGMRLSNIEKTHFYELKDTTEIQGVYYINRGYCVFKSVDILETNSDYCIVSEKKSNIELYDRIILNSSTVKENQIIY